METWESEIAKNSWSFFFLHFQNHFSPELQSRYLASRSKSNEIYPKMHILFQVIGFRSQQRSRMGRKCQILHVNMTFFIFKPTSVRNKPTGSISLWFQSAIFYKLKVIWEKYGGKCSLYWGPQLQKWLKGPFLVVCFFTLTSLSPKLPTVFQFSRSNQTVVLLAYGCSGKHLKLCSSKWCPDKTIMPTN